MLLRELFRGRHVKAKLSLALGSGAVALLAGAWRPFFSASFFPIDDHEIITYLAYRNDLGTSAIWTGIYEFSPMKAVPNSVHWRPSMWIMRIVEAELFGDTFKFFAVTRFLELVISGALLSLAILLFLRSLRPELTMPRQAAVAALVYFVLFISASYWTDVHGRHMAAERHTILAVSLLAIGFGFSRQSLAFGRKPHGWPLILCGLTLLVMTKENATYLVPLLGFATVGSASRRLGRPKPFFVVWTLVVILPLWLLASITVFRSTVQGASLVVPYAGEVGIVDILRIVLDLPSNVFFLTVGGVVLVTSLKPVLRRDRDLGALLILAFAVVVMEHVFARTVAVSAPRYSALSFTFALACMVVVGCKLFDAGSIYLRLPVQLLILPCVALCFFSGLTNTHNRLEWNQSESQLWNAEVNEVADRIRDAPVDVVLVIVDPPQEDRAGRVEKTFSLIKFLDWRLEKGVSFEMAPQELIDGQRYDEPSYRNLLGTASNGSVLNGGVEVRPYGASINRGRFCILYSTSGRDTSLLDDCVGTYRFTL